MKLVEANKMKGAIDIGVYHGGTTIGLSEVLERGPIVGIDIIDPIIDVGKVKKRFHYVQASSYELSTVKKVRAFASQVQVLFIDGQHGYKNVKRDFAYYLPMVDVNKGIIALHDILTDRPWFGVKKLWGEIVEAHGRAHTMEICAQPHTWGGIGVLFFGDVLR